MHCGSRASGRSGREGAVPRALYGPACSLARAAGAARGRRAGTAGNGTGTRAPPFLPASALLRAGALEPTWAPPRGHRDPWRCVHLFCFSFCRSLGCPRAPGTRPVTCSTAHAWVRPPKPSAQMGKQAQRGEAAYLSHSSKASRAPRQVQERTLARALRDLHVQPSIWQMRKLRPGEVTCHAQGLS